MKRALLAIMVGALYVLHQDFWFWRTATPLAFGFIPVGLFYHACYTILVALAFWLLVKHAWPAHLEQNLEGRKTTEGGDLAVSISPGGPAASSEEGQAR